MEYTREERDGYIIFTIDGNFVIGKKGHVSEEYSELLEQGYYKFIFDLRKVDIIDSSGLGTIILGISNVMKKNEKIKIVLDPKNETIKNIFRYIKIEQVISFFRTIDDALNDENQLVLN